MAEFETLTMHTVLRATEREVRRQDENYGPFASDIAKVRLAIACLEDEVGECLEGWRNAKLLHANADYPRSHPDWFKLREETIQVAAVALRLARDVEVPNVD